MSTIEDVRAAEKKMKEILATPDDLHEDLRKATDEYASACSRARVEAVSHWPE
jgi:hypothetical protein